MKTKVIDEHRTMTYGSTTLPAIIGTGTVKNSSPSSVYAGMVLGLTQDFDLGEIGLRFEHPIISAGIDELEKSEKFSGFAKMPLRMLSDGETFEKAIVPESCFTEQELSAVASELGEDLASIREHIPANATPDAILGDSACVEVRVRSETGSRLIAPASLVQVTCITALLSLPKCCLGSTTKTKLT